MIQKSVLNTMLCYIRKCIIPMRKERRNRLQLHKSEDISQTVFTILHDNKIERAYLSYKILCVRNFVICATYLYPFILLVLVFLSENFVILQRVLIRFASRKKHYVSIILYEFLFF